jgi:hypothetical protein
MWSTSRGMSFPERIYGAAVTPASCAITTHIETYWVPKYVEAAMGELVPFYARTF